jgi:hypothetical protein
MYRDVSDEELRAMDDFDDAEDDDIISAMSHLAPAGARPFY